MPPCLMLHYTALHYTVLHHSFCDPIFIPACTNPIPISFRCSVLLGSFLTVSHSRLLSIYGKVSVSGSEYQAWMQQRAFCWCAQDVGWYVAWQGPWTWKPCTPMFTTRSTHEAVTRYSLFLVHLVNPHMCHPSPPTYIPPSTLPTLTCACQGRRTMVLRKTKCAKRFMICAWMGALVHDPCMDGRLAS